MGRARSILTVAGLATAGIALWARRNPSACPYAFRLFVEVPHPGISRKRLVEILDPRAGEQILEIGPGTGYYSLEVASRIEGGRLAIFDIQREFLDHTVQAAAERGLQNVEPTEGDAQWLPYGDESFDAAYLVTVLGEIPDQGAALGELHRVLKQSGRLIVGETALGDPHFVTAGKLAEGAERAGFGVERRLGSRFAYFALLRK
jgi:ubiquinone/menaquinone biosynthesis C-methylase UbiE